MGSLLSISEDSEWDARVEELRKHQERGRSWEEFEAACDLRVRRLSELCERASRDSELGQMLRDYPYLVEKFAADPELYDRIRRDAVMLEGAVTDTNSS